MKKEFRKLDITKVPAEYAIRMVDESDLGEGIFEGYAAVWDDIDSHGTIFKRGCFKKTIQERGGDIKVLYQHDVDEPIGKLVEVREDDNGLFVIGQLTIGIKRADETILNIVADVLNTLSFGFDPINSEIEKIRGKKVRAFTEVKLYEVSPVTFASNENARITDVRNDDDDEIIPDDSRDVDFNETLEQEMLRSQGWKLMNALDYTLDDIWWDSANGDEVITLVDRAISEFHLAYIGWARQFIGKFWEERRAVMAKNRSLSVAMQRHLKEADKTPELLAAETSFTVGEINSLSAGELLSTESRRKLAELPDEIRVAHQRSRNKLVETLCNELRAVGFSPAEQIRFESLLGLNTRDLSTTREEDLSFDIVGMFESFNTDLGVPDTEE